MKARTKTRQMRSTKRRIWRSDKGRSRWWIARVGNPLNNFPRRTCGPDGERTEPSKLNHGMKCTAPSPFCECPKCFQAKHGEKPLVPAHGSVWVETKDRMPTAGDAQNRMGHVWWMVCDGFVCEPSKERWDWKCYPSCHAVAWMPIPPHPKWYPLNDSTVPPLGRRQTTKLE